MLTLYKKQKELIAKSLEIKKRQLEEIENKQKEIEEIARRMQIDRTQIENLVRLLFEYRASNGLGGAIPAAVVNNNNSSSSSSSLSIPNGGAGAAATMTSSSSTSSTAATAAAAAAAAAAVAVSSSYLDNLMRESEIKKKIMLISLGLASDPSVSHLVQRHRREFYEKTKKKVTLQF